ncbi:hypothetical protein P692DRAFT_20878313 [Suillus brevipes Sb2]|nr:hypothetical protein P692DRAFT_20878313 [Suillus brevipes Sb2]
MPPSIPSVSMLEDTIVLDIDNLNPDWNTYCCHIDIKSPGLKKVVFHLKAPVIKTEEGAKKEGLQSMATVKVEDGDITLIPMEPGMKIKSEDSDLLIFPWACEVSPCKVLTRRLANPNRDPENPTAAWHYLVRPFPASNIPSEIAKMAALRQQHEDLERGVVMAPYRLTFPLV